MKVISKRRALDETVAFRADPYRFISKRCRELGTDVFETRLQLRKTLCMSGPAAARLFYDTKRFRRAGAAPEPVRATLFGKGGVQGLDGARHLHRKQMFMSLMTRPSIDRLTELAHQELIRHAETWAPGASISLYDTLLDALARAACQWAGVPIEEPGFAKRVRDIAMLFDSAANDVRGHLRSRAARHRSERWISGLIRSVRDGQFKAVDGSALAVVALHRELDGHRMAVRIAAVELLNLIRPTVAVAVFIVQTAHAMHEHPELMPRIREVDDAYVERFVLEIRRFYPFFPTLVARVAEDFEWSGHVFRSGRRVMLDVYGTNRDERAWHDPEAFDPDRFHEWNGDAYSLIAQGGGDHLIHHRCPGEWITIALMKMAVRFLAREIDFDVPQQDLRLDFAHLPALPVDRFVIRKISRDLSKAMRAISPSGWASRARDVPSRGTQH
jgi:fatty-acid peroxygenase